MEYYPILENGADIFTKALGKEVLEKHLHHFGIGPKR